MQHLIAKLSAGQGRRVENIGQADDPGRFDSTRNIHNIDDAHDLGGMGGIDDTDGIDDTNDITEIANFGHFDELDAAQSREHGRGHPCKLGAGTRLLCLTGAVAMTTALLGTQLSIASGYVGAADDMMAARNLVRMAAASQAGATVQAQPCGLAAKAAGRSRQTGAACPGG